MRIAICLVFLSAVITSLSSCSKSDNNDPAADLPEASINNVSQERTATAATFHFVVSLNKTASVDATIHYATVAASAKENTDYTPVSGTLTIAAGEKQAAVDVTVTGDSTRKANQVFYVQLDDAKNCKLTSAGKGTGTIVNENGLYYPVDNTGYTSANTYPGYTLTWSDEFNGSSISNTNWAFETGNNNGWGNNELENYANSTRNAFVSDGNLIIEARQEGSSYTSARMITKGHQSFTFGRVDIRTKLPKGQGIWPALWLLGSNIDAVGWPACGEIDMMELLGQEPNKMYGTLHWGATFASHASKGTNYVLGSGSFDEQFHVYSMLWKQDSITLYVDDNQFLSVSKTDVAGSDYPFNKDFFFIFNIAVGGNWPGNPDSNTSFPQRMVVDYVRVFQ